MSVVPFPRQPLHPDASPLRDGQPMTRCDDPIHVFANPGGVCQCGEHRWDEPSTAVGISGVGVEVSAAASWDPPS